MINRYTMPCFYVFLYFFSARPGRPPKRSALVTPDTLEKLKKSRTENGDCFNPNRMMGKYETFVNKHINLRLSGGGGWGRSWGVKPEHRASYRCCKIW